MFQTNRPAPNPAVEGTSGPSLLGIRNMRHAIALLFALASLPVQADSLPPEIRRALAAIPTVTGRNVLQRMKLCGITFADGSWIEKQTAAIPQIGSRVGDTILEVYINIPPMPGDDRPEAKVIYNGLFAQWIIRNGKPIPISGWAKTLQQAPIPIRSERWMNC